MSRQMLMLIGGMFFIFTSGVAVGLFFGGGSGDAISDAAGKDKGGASTGFFSSAEAQERVEGNTVLSDRIRELEKELDEQKENQHAAVAGRLAFFKKYHDQIHVSAFGGDPIKIAPEMAELLGLSKEEQKAVEQHLTEAAKAMAQIEDANTVLVKQTANSVSFETPADPQGKTIEEKLKSALASDIGQDRADFLMTSAWSNYSDAFSGFAEGKIGMDISWTMQNGVPFYTWKQTGYRPDGTAAGWGSSSGSSLPAKYQNLIQSAKP
jgi:hypothetical protein